MTTSVLPRDYAARSRFYPHVLAGNPNSGLYSASRMFSALATQGFAPKIMAKKSKRGVPLAALLASTVGGVIATIMNFSAPGSGIFEFIMNSAGLVALFF